jgi:hypothetical protein
MSDTASPNVGYIGLESSAFPFVLEFFRVSDPDGADCIHRVEVPSPGLIHIPQLKQELDAPVWVRMSDATGLVTEQWPAGYSRESKAA